MPTKLLLYFVIIDVKFRKEEQFIFKGDFYDRETQRKPDAEAQGKEKGYFTGCDESSSSSRPDRGWRHARLQ